MDGATVRRSPTAAQYGVLRPVPVEPEAVSLFSIRPIRRWGAYVASAVRRHLVIATAVFVGCALAVGTVIASAPPNYQTTATILLAGDRGLGGTDGVTFAASRQARAVILRIESLDRMIDELGLIENQPDVPFFGRVAEALGGAGDAETERRQMRDQLRSSIYLFGNEGQAAIDITVLWPDAIQAVAIAQLAYDIFLEDRTIAEVEPLERSVEILSERASRASANAQRLREELDLSPSDGAPAGSVLESAVRIEQDLQSQLRTAEVELDEVEAGVALRYALNQSPELPSQPASGNLVNYVVTLVVAAMAAAGVAFWLERPRGRVVEAWQLEGLGRPIVTAPALESTD